MARGFLRAFITLDDPDRVYCGPDDPVTGYVDLVYRQPWENAEIQAPAELLGSLKLDLVLKGAIRSGYSTLKHHNLQSTLDFKEYYEDRDRVSVVSERSHLHDGHFSALAGEVYSFPFEIFFPEYANPTPPKLTYRQKYSPTGKKTDSRRASLSPELLPSSLVVMQRRMTDSYVVAVQYVLEVETKMEGVNVDIVRSPTGTVVMYGQPSIATPSFKQKLQTHSSEQKLSIRSARASPRHDRTRGLLSRARSILKPSDHPSLSFYARCFDVPGCVCADQALSCKLTVRADPNNISAPGVPDPPVAIDRIIAYIGSTTTLVGKCPNLTQMAQHLHATSFPPGPFTEEHANTKEIELGVLNQLPTSFVHSRLEHKYELRLAIWLRIAKRQIIFTRSFPLVVESSEPAAEVERVDEVLQEDDNVVRSPGSAEAVAEPSCAIAGGVGARSPL